jgi:hypothetical protein
VTLETAGDKAAKCDLMPAVHFGATSSVKKSAGNKKPATLRPSPLAPVHLHALKERDLLTWRDSLPQQLAASTRHRISNDLKAALNAAWPKISEERRMLNPTFLTNVSAGCKAERTFDDGEASAARDNQILADKQIAVLIRSAHQVDAAEEVEGDLHRIVAPWVLPARGIRRSGGCG